jgi:hypothetical protein
MFLTRINLSNKLNKRHRIASHNNLIKNNKELYNSTSITPVCHKTLFAYKDDDLDINNYHGRIKRGEESYELTLKDLDAETVETIRSPDDALPLLNKILCGNNISNSKIVEPIVVPTAYNQYCVAFKDGKYWSINYIEDENRYYDITIVARCSNSFDKVWNNLYTSVKYWLLKE